MDKIVYEEMDILFGEDEPLIGSPEIDEEVFDELMKGENNERENNGEETGENQ